MEIFKEILSRSKWKDEMIKKLWPKSEEYKENRVFYLGPFHEPYNTLYSELIKPLIEYYNLECHRDDEDALSQPFFDRILKNIKTSRFILVNLSENRPNVLIELGWVTAMANQCLIFTTEDRPSDIAQISIPKYNFSIDGLRSLENNILEALLQSGVIKRKKPSLDINFNSIIQAFEIYKLINTKTILFVKVGEEGKIDTTIRIPLKTEIDREEANLIPVDISVFDIEERRKTETQFNQFHELHVAAQQLIQQEDLESYKKRCENYNTALANLNEEEINKYLMSCSIFRYGSKITFILSNYGDRTLNNVEIEIEFPESIKVMDEMDPEPIPLLERPVRKTIFTNISSPFESLSTLAINPQPSSIPKIKGINTAEAKNICVGSIAELKHKRDTEFPLKLQIFPTSEGKFKVQYWFISDELPDWISGSLTIEVGD